MTSRSRACDTCRLRKTRCVKENGEDRCVLCKFHDHSCTYVQGPLRRKRARQASFDEEATEQDQEHGRDELPWSSGHSQHFTAASVSNIPAQPSPSSQQPDSPGMSTSPATAYPGIINETLGLAPATHAGFLGSTDYREPILLELSRPANSDSVRRMDDRVLFSIYTDGAAASEAKRIQQLDAIEAIVQPRGQKLVDLYFRFVHPSFPILHKEVFITKYESSYRLFAPSLLAAVYLLALDWQLHDSVLATSDAESKIDVLALERLAEVAMEDDMRRPKLSTLEAGLLLLQKSSYKGGPTGGSSASIWRFHAQMVAVAQELGVHVDCSTWLIPEWEIGLRRRLAWALFLQDRWNAFIHGRPILIHDSDWDVRPCSSPDFPEYAGSSQSSTGDVSPSTGWSIFLHQIELAQILGQIIDIYYTVAATRRGGHLDNLGIIEAVDLAKPITARLRDWQATLPENLLFTSSRPRSLCASASLHLAYSAVLVALYRALVRLFTADTPSSLKEAIRTAARAKVDVATDLLNSMQPEHTSAFWGSAAAHQVALIGSLAGLLWATAETTDEVAWCAARIEDLKWALRVRGAAAPFAREALQLIERQIGGLSIIDST